MLFISWMWGEQRLEPPLMKLFPLEEHLKILLRNVWEWHVYFSKYFLLQLLKPLCFSFSLLIDSSIPEIPLLNQLWPLTTDRVSSLCLSFSWTMVLVLHQVPAVSCFIGTFSSHGWGSAGLWWSHGYSLSGMTWTWVLAWHRTFSFCPFVLSTTSNSARECHPLHSHLRSVWVSDTFMGHHWAVSHTPASLTWDAVLRPDTHFHFCPRRPQWSQLWDLTWTNTFCVGTSPAPPPPLLGVCPTGLLCTSRDVYPSPYAGSWVRVLLDYPLSFPAHVALWLTDACSCPPLLTFSHICPNLNRFCALVTQGHSGGGCGLPANRTMCYAHIRASGHTCWGLAQPR